MNQEEKSLIDRYLSDSLTGSELSAFISKMNSTPEFKSRVEMHRVLIKGIQYAEDGRLTNMLEKHINYEKPLVPYALKLILTFLIVTVGGIGLWNYLGPEDNQKTTIFSFDFLKSRRDTTISQSEATTPVAFKPPPKIHKPAKDSMVNADAEHKRDTAILADQSTEIIVKKDQLLISFVLKPIDVEELLKPKEPLNENLPPKEHDAFQQSNRTQSFKVEFWVSPINYRGYKLLQDKLILFGIEEPDAVQLFSNEKNLWMKYGREFYALHQTDEFESLVQTGEVPQAIK